MDTIVTPVTVITLDSTRIVHSIKADLVARYFPPVVRLVQYDMSLPVIAVSLMQNGQTYTLPSGAAANIRVHKPDATYVYNPALGCDSTRNIVYFEVTQAMAAANGDGLAIVEIVVDGDIAGTSLITLHFEENPVPEDAIESSDEWETIYELGERIIASTVTPVSTAAGMTDHNVVYLYTGTESGWNQGHMYYYNGTTWVDAGIAVTDKTLTVEGLAADAKKTGEEIADLKDGLTAVESDVTDLKEDLQSVHGDLIDVTELQTNNLLSGVVWEMGSIDLNTGNNMSSNTRIRTADYIDVSNIDIIDFSVNSGYMFVVDFFASDKSVLNVAIHGSWKSTAQRVIIPANVVYIRMLVSNSNSTAADVSYSKEVFATYYSHATKIVNNSFDNLNGLIGGGSGTGNASATKVYSYASYCLNASGKLTAMESTDNTYLVDKYEVQEGKAYAITGCGLANYAVCAFIDKDNNTLSYYSCSQYQGNWSAWFIWKNQIVVAPKNAIYLYVAFRNSVVTQGKAEVVTPLGYPKRWTNVKWACMGDSLTELNNRANKHYYNYITDETGINFVVLGKSGTGYMKAYGSNLPFSQRIDTIPTDSNVITIFGSGNDVGQTLGNVTDTGTNTVCGCINNTIDGIRSRITGANLGIITPTPWESYPPSTVGNAMDLYVDALVEICKMKGVPCLDLYHCSNMTPWDSDFKTAYYSHDDGNGTHPDENGHKLFAPRIKAFLETLLM